MYFRNNMKETLRRHPDIVLAALALTLTGIVIYAYAWGIGNAAGAVYQAVSAPASGSLQSGFNLQGARQLDLRGLVNNGQ